jgi:predicted Zn-dependent peptidase
MTPVWKWKLYNLQPFYPSGGEPSCPPPVSKRHLKGDMHSMNKYACRFLPVLLIVFASSLYAQNLQEFEKKLTQFRLDNGITFLVYERHEVPVVSFFTYADTGSVDEQTGETGLAHIFEHMAFKGTTIIGTKDIQKEQAAMNKEDEAFGNLRAERDKRDHADPKKIEQLQKAFEEAKTEAAQYSNGQEFTEAISRAGGKGLNAETSADATQYYYSLPSNKLELWFTLESDRFLNPVLREFYQEKDVVMEERRMSVDSEPEGRLGEELLAAAFKAHPYGEPTVGWMSDLQSIGRPEAVAFFKTHYIPANLTIAIVGDADPQQVKQLAHTYFDRLPASPKPRPVETVEPEQQGERRVTLAEKTQPFVVIAFHKGDVLNADEEAFNVLSDVIGRGRASRLYKNLIKQKKIAIHVEAGDGDPGNKYPNLMEFYIVPSQGHSPEECEQATYQEIDRLKSELITPEELKKAKNRARADVIRSLGDNIGIAQLLALNQALTGDWRSLFRDIDKLNAVTAQDVQRVARQYLTEKNRTVGTTKTTE